MPERELDQEVRSKLFQLMTGLLPLRDFQRWFALVAWELGAGSPEAHPLTRRVELRLAEYTNGDWSESQLLNELGGLIRPLRVTFSSPPDWHPASSTTSRVS